MIKTIFKKPFIFTREWVVSLFLCSYLLFPILNALEMVVYSTQGGSVVFILSVSVILRVLFWFSPNMYDTCLGVVFGYALIVYFNIFGWGIPVLKNYPRSVGIFYGCCIVSTFARFEFDDVVWLQVMAAILYLIRNLFIIPFLGVNFLASWLSSETSRMESLDLIPRHTYQELLNPDLTFHVYDCHFVRFNPLIYGRSHKYSLQTRRGMFRVVKHGAELTGIHAEKITIYTGGTTAAGSAILASYSAGSGKDKAIHQTHQETVGYCKSVLATTTNPTEKHLALKILDDSLQHRANYEENNVAITLVRGMKTLVRSKDIVTPSTGVFDQLRRAHALKTASQMTGPDREFYLKKASGRVNSASMSPSTPGAPGVASPNEIWYGFLEMFRF